jgi:acylphosphatase
MSAATEGETRIARIIVEGRVQNVGYRVFVAREAGRLHLAGWVRNRGAFAVETVAAGPQRAVEEFIALAAKGPATAHVETFRIEQADASALVEGGGEHGFVAAPAI